MRAISRKKFISTLLSSGVSRKTLSRASMKSRDCAQHDKRARTAWFSVLDYSDVFVEHLSSGQFRDVEFTGTSYDKTSYDKTVITFDKGRRVSRLFNRKEREKIPQFSRSVCENSSMNFSSLPTIATLNLLYHGCLQLYLKRCLPFVWATIRYSNSRFTRALIIARD